MFSSSWECRHGSSESCKTFSRDKIYLWTKPLWISDYPNLRTAMHIETRACHRNSLTQKGKHNLHLQTTVWKGILWRSDTHKEDTLPICLSRDYVVNVVCPARVGPPMALEGAEVFPKYPMSSHHAPAAAEVQQWPTGCIGWHNLLFMGNEGEVTALGQILTLMDFKGTKRMEELS